MNEHPTKKFKKLIISHNYDIDKPKYSKKAPNGIDKIILVIQCKIGKQDLCLHVYSHDSVALLNTKLFSILFLVCLCAHVVILKGNTTGLLLTLQWEFNEQLSK